MDIAEIVKQISLIALPVLMALTFHEVAHGWVAFKLGDSTAKDLGRLTLNPLKHLDPVGTLVFVLTRMIGWAKPVPVDPRNFQNPRKDMVWVALAGPGANIILAIISAGILRFLPRQFNPYATDFSDMILMPFTMMVYYSVMINLALAIFNIIPIPPLDGGRVVHGLLSEENAEKYARIEPYGFLIILAMVFLDITDIILVPVIQFAMAILV